MCRCLLVGLQGASAGKEVARSEEEEEEARVNGVTQRLTGNIFSDDMLRRLGDASLVWKQELQKVFFFF